MQSSRDHEEAAGQAEAAEAAEGVARPKKRKNENANMKQEVENETVSPTSSPHCLIITLFSTYITLRTCLLPGCSTLIITLVHSLTSDF